MEDSVTESPEFCPACQENLGYKNVYFDYARVPKYIFVPDSMKDSYYCFNCFARFIDKHTKELEKFKLIKDK